MNMREIQLTVNGKEYITTCAPSDTLLHVLRENLHLTGTKEGCGAGECGACAVIMNDEPVNSCMVMAIEANGASIRTVEGEAAEDGTPSDLQESFMDHGAIQCGFCTPGMVMSARALLDKNANPTKEEIVEAMEGNLCRCTGYDTIIKAVESVAGGEAE